MNDRIAMDALAAACAAPAAGMASVVDQKSRWMLGRAVPAKDGTFALGNESGVQVVVNRDDVLSVEQDGENFLVEVKPNARMVARLEQSISAEAACNCEGSDMTTASSMTGFNSNGWGCDWELRVVCRLRMVAGALRLVCFPEPVRVCVPPPPGPPPM